MPGYEEWSIVVRLRWFSFLAFSISIFFLSSIFFFVLFLFPFHEHSECLTYLIEINRPFNPVGVLFIHYWHCFNVNRSIQFTNLFSYAMRCDAMVPVPMLMLLKTIIVNRVANWLLLCLNLINAFDTFFPTLKNTY